VNRVDVAGSYSDVGCRGLLDVRCVLGVIKSRGVDDVLDGFVVVG
jgi:hypothetical protein